MFHCNMWQLQRYLGNVVPDYAQSSIGKIPGAFMGQAKREKCKKSGNINGNRQKV